MSAIEQLQRDIKTTKTLIESTEYEIQTQLNHMSVRKSYRLSARAGMAMHDLELGEQMLQILREYKLRSEIELKRLNTKLNAVNTLLQSE